MIMESLIVLVVVNTYVIQITLKNKDYCQLFPIVIEAYGLILMEKSMHLFKSLSLVLFTCLLINLPTFAHDEPDPDPEAWKKTGAIGFNLTSGNQDTTLLTVDLRATQEKGKNIWNFQIREAFGESEDSSGSKETNVDETTGLAEYKRLLDERWYIGAAVAAERDDVQDIDYRVVPGVLLGHFLVKNDATQFSLEAGPAYVFEKVGGETNEYFAPKIGDRFSHKLSDTASIFQSAFVTFDIDDSDNYIIEGEVGIEAALSSALSLIVSLRDTYDNVPADGLKRNDLMLTSALGFRF